MTFHRILFSITFCLALFQFPAVSLCQSGNVWGTTPVFDGGRVMPLKSFAKRIVTEICGESKPFIVRDDSILAELVRVADAKIGDETGEENKDSPDQQEYPFLVRGIDILGDPGAATTTPVPAKTTGTALAIRNMTSFRANSIYGRIRALIPMEGRYFEPEELLLSWIVEPDVWDYIPLFPVAENDYRTDVLDLFPKNNAGVSLKRVAVFQLKQSTRFQQRLAEIERKQMQRQSVDIPIKYDQITERIAVAMNTFQELTFHPLKTRPTRMIGLLQQSVDFSMGQMSSYASALESWGRLLGLGEVPARQTLEAVKSGREETEEKESQLHPTTQRWHDIVKKIRLISVAFDRLDKNGEMTPPNLPAVEKQLEILLRMIDINFEESEALMENVYPGVVFRKTTMEGTNVNKWLPLLSSPVNKEKNKELLAKIALNYHYSIKKLRAEVEAAYLALYDNGRSVRILPVAASSATGDLATSSLGVQPWGTIQMVLYGGEFFVRRFFDANYHFDPAETETEPTTLGPAELLEEIRKLRRETMQALTAENETEEMADNPEVGVDDEEGVQANKEKQPENAVPQSEAQLLEKELFAKNEPLFSLSSSRSSASQPVTSDGIGRIRFDLVRLTSAYITGTRSPDDVAGSLLKSLREASIRSEALREQFLENNRSEYVTKTQYPQQDALITEVRYQQLAPFFWMWVFAAGAIVFAGISFLLGKVRWEMIGEIFSQNEALRKKLKYSEKKSMYYSDEDLSELNSTDALEEYTFWISVALLGLSIFVTFLGGAMRAWITGWAPVTNMYETVVLMAFSASLFGLWYALYPLVYPVIQMAWHYSSLPELSHFSKLFPPKKTEQADVKNPGDRNSAIRQAASNYGISGETQPATGANSEEKRRDRLQKAALLWQLFLFVPRLILMFLTFLVVVHLSYGEYAHEHGVFAAAVEMLKMSDFIDWIVVVASIGVIVWFVPQLILTTLLIPVLFCRPSLIAAELGIVSQTIKTTLHPLSSDGHGGMNYIFQGESVAMGNIIEDNSGSVWISMVRNQILDRTLFVIVAASVALLAGLASYFNTSEFNPEIKPIVAVLRSNFWLTVHVIAIVVSYAAALVAWGMSVVALGDAIFGRYRYTEIQSTATEKRTYVQIPVICEMFAPIIRRLLQSALVLLVIGTILGARWADYSWGRFWSWDPKEVWALITILFYVIVLHGRLARFYDRIGIMVGALFASIAVIITWYGINFVFKGSIHSYGGGAASSATLFLGIFILANILWGFLAIFRYNAEMYGRES